MFLYAKDKRDLLFLVFNEDADRVADEAIAAAHAVVFGNSTADGAPRGALTSTDVPAATVSAAR